MRRWISAATTSCLALSLTLTTGCGSVVRTLVPQVEQVDRPDPPAVLIQGCPAAPAMPARADLPANDIRPLVAIFVDQVDAGDQCRIVVDGWKAWDVCMRLRLKDKAAACPVLDAIVQQLETPPAPRPLSTPMPSRPAS